MRVLTWNLFHGRSVPDTPRALRAEFGRMLAGWDWDVALLQEVPSWWPPGLAAECGAVPAAVRTSRNQLHPITRRLAERRPDIVKSWDGGANAILVRGHGVTAHHRLRLRIWPERRMMHAVRRDDGVWLANLHARAHDAAKAEDDLRRSAAALIRWSGDEPAVIGGDTNTREPAFPGFEHCGGHVLDQVYARGLPGGATAVTLPRHDAELGANLSDHKPVLATIGQSIP